MCIRDRSGCNGIKNNDGDMMMNNNEEIINEVSDSHKNELTNSSGKIVENEIYKSDTVKINSDDENIEIVRESEGVMGVGGCEGVEISVYKLELSLIHI